MAKTQFMKYLTLLLSFIWTMNGVIPPFAYSADKKLKFLYVPGEKSAFYVAIAEGIRKKGIELGITTIVTPYPQSWDPHEQIKIVEEAVDKHQPNLMIIATSPKTGILDSLPKIREPEISVITIEQFMGSIHPPEHVSKQLSFTHVSSDNRSGGKALAIRLANLIAGKGKVYINSTFPDVKSISQRFKAFLQALRAYPNISIAGIDIAGIDFSNKAGGGVGSSMELQNNARKQTIEMLQRHPDINAIYCPVSISAIGVINALNDTGLSGSIKVVTWGATLTISQAMDDGIIDIALSPQPEIIGKTAVFLGHQHLVFGERIPSRTLIPFIVLDRETLSVPKSEQSIY